MKRAAIVELDDRRRIDVDADDFHPGGQQIADRHRVQRRGDHQAERNIANLLAHLPLRFERVGDHIGQRAVVADAAGEQKIDVVSSRIRT